MIQILPDEVWQGERHTDEQGSIYDAVSGNEIFEVGGKDNELSEAAKRVLENMLSGKCEKSDPFENFAEGRPALCFDFHEERKRCLKHKLLFEDPEFPADATSIAADRGHFSFDVDDVRWLRPGEIVDDPQFILKNMSRFDTVQGRLGDCYMIATAATLAMHEELFYRVVPPDQSFTQNYAGIFHFQFWRYGTWVDVVIDDRLPTLGDELLFMHSGEENEFWAALLEKAYAKMYGSYGALRGGRTLEVMEDFTGGIVEVYYTSKVPRQVLLSVLMRAKRSGALINCGISSVERHYHQRRGLCSGHAYSITGLARVIHDEDGEIDIIRIRNPWGDETQWEGPWGDDSPEWDHVGAEDKKYLEVAKKEDGEFWMSFADYVDEFTHVEICTLGPGGMEELCQMTGKEKAECTSSWRSASFHGQWSMENSTAGGQECSDFPNTWMGNPQYSLHIPDAGQDTLVDGTCAVIVTLTQKYTREECCFNCVKGLAVYRCKGPRSDRLTCANCEEAFLLSKPRHLPIRDVTKRVNLKPGYYVIIPSAVAPADQTQFLLRILADGPFEIKELVASKVGEAK